MTMALSAEVQRLVAELHLKEHPEGGWYRETYRSPMQLQTPKGERSLATLIYYLLPAGVESRIHCVSWDEIWLWQGGGVLDVRRYRADTEYRKGEYSSHLLGYGAGAQPQQLMPAGSWFNAVVVEGDYALAACMVAPGFDFADLTML